LEWAGLLTGRIKELDQSTELKNDWCQEKIMPNNGVHLKVSGQEVSFGYKELSRSLRKLSDCKNYPFYNPQCGEEP
jgi:hypothetical protein